MLRLPASTWRHSTSSFTRIHRVSCDWRPRLQIPCARHLEDCHADRKLHWYKQKCNTDITHLYLGSDIYREYRVDLTLASCEWRTVGIHQEQDWFLREIDISLRVSMRRSSHVWDLTGMGAREKSPSRYYCNAFIWEVKSHLELYMIIFVSAQTLFSSILCYFPSRSSPTHNVGRQVLCVFHSQQIFLKLANMIAGWSVLITSHGRRVF